MKLKLKENEADTQGLLQVPVAGLYFQTKERKHLDLDLSFLAL